MEKLFSYKCRPLRCTYNRCNGHVIANDENEAEFLAENLLIIGCSRCLGNILLEEVRMNGYDIICKRR